MADSFDPYAELQLSPDAEPELIKAAFKALAKKYHPDKFSDPAEKRRAEEKMARINEAQQMLASGGYQPPPSPTSPPPPAPPPTTPRAEPATSRSSPAYTERRPKASSTIRKGPFVAAALFFVSLLFLPQLFSGNHLEKALQYEEQGRLQDSLTHLNKAVAENPHDRELFAHRARIWDKLGEPEKAAVDRQNARQPALSFPSATPTPEASKVPDAPVENSDSHVP